MTDLVVGVCLQTLPCCLPPPRAPPLFSSSDPLPSFQRRKAAYKDKPPTLAVGCSRRVDSPQLKLNCTLIVRHLHLTGIQEVSPWEALVLRAGHTLVVTRKAMHSIS